MSIYDNCYILILRPFIESEDEGYFNESRLVDRHVETFPAATLDEARRAAGGYLLGSIKSDKQAAASRENGRKGGRPKKSL